MPRLKCGLFSLSSGGRRSALASEIVDHGRNRGRNGTERKAGGYSRAENACVRTIHAGLLIATVILGGAIPVRADGPWRASEVNTRGWQLMTPQERIEHQSRVREFSDYDACEAYRIQHDELMAERAKQRGLLLREDGQERDDKRISVAG